MGGVALHITPEFGLSCRDCERAVTKFGRNSAGILSAATATKNQTASVFCEC